MSTSLLIEQFRLRCSVASLLISAAELEVKEYEAGWRDGGVKVFRQGGRFASATAKGAGAAAESAKQAIAREIEEVKKSQDALSRTVFKALDKAFGKVSNELAAAASVQSEQFTAEQLEQPEVQRAIAIVNGLIDELNRQYKEEIQPQIEDSDGDPTKALEELMTSSLEDTKDLDKSFEAYLQDGMKAAGPRLTQSTISAAGVVVGGTIGIVAMSVAFPPSIPVIASIGVADLLASAAASTWAEPIYKIGTDALLRFYKITGRPDQKDGGKAIEDIVSGVTSATVSGFTARLIELPFEGLAAAEKAAAAAEAKSAAAAAQESSSQLKALDLDEMPNTIDDLRGAYLAAAKKHHPEGGGSNEKMREVNEAFAQLKALLKKPGEIK